MGYNSKYTGAQIESMLENAEAADRNATKASSDAAEALRQAKVAVDAIATLKGLENSDEVMVEIAKQITRIEQNVSDITKLQNQHELMTDEQFNALEQKDESKIYMIYEE